MRPVAVRFAGAAPRRAWAVCCAVARFASAGREDGLRLAAVFAGRAVPRSRALAFFLPALRPVALLAWHFPFRVDSLPRSIGPRRAPLQESVTKNR
jgi:hypothetical protein